MIWCFHSLIRDLTLRIIVCRVSMRQSLHSLVWDLTRSTSQCTDLTIRYYHSLIGDLQRSTTALTAQAWLEDSMWQGRIVKAHHMPWNGSGCVFGLSAVSLQHRDWSQLVKTPASYPILYTNTRYDILGGSYTRKRKSRSQQSVAQRTNVRCKLHMFILNRPSLQMYSNLARSSRTWICLTSKW